MILMFVSYSALGIGLYLHVYYRKKVIAQLKKKREKNDRSILIFKKLIIYFSGELSPKRKSCNFLMRALITHEIMCSKDAQCNTKE